MQALEEQLRETARTAYQCTKKVTIDLLYTDVRDGEYRFADYNRSPVWSREDMQSFVSYFMQLGIIPPICVLHPAQSEPLAIYDGVNRVTAISNFIEGKFALTINSLKFYFRKPPGSTALELTPRGRRDFMRREIDVSTWHNITEQQACQIALAMNSGTPARPSDRLRWLVGNCQTPRCMLLDEVVRHPSCAVMLELHPYEALYTWVAELIMRVDSNDWREMQAQIRCFKSLERFYR